MRAQAQYTIYTLNDVQSEETAPASPYLGQLWVDTSTSPPITRVWNGAEWVELNGTDKIKDDVNYVTKQQNDFEQSAGRYFNQISETIGRVEKDFDDVEEKYTKVSESVTKLEQTAGEVSVEATKDGGTLKTTISSDGTWESKYSKNGSYVSGLYFDFTSGKFVFDGDIVGGSMNINNNFVVSEDGRVSAKNAHIAGDIDATSGSIGGWGVNDRSLCSASLLNRNYFTSEKRKKGEIIYMPGTVDFSNSQCPYGFYALGNTSEETKLRFRNVITGNGNWTLSWDMRGSQSSRFAGFSVSICDYPSKRFAVTADNEWRRHSITVNVKNYTAGFYNFVDFFDISWAYIYVRNIKLEKSSTVTPWTPAPEDNDHYPTTHIWTGIGVRPAEEIFIDNTTVLAIGWIGSGGETSKNDAIAGSWDNAAFRVSANGMVTSELGGNIGGFRIDEHQMSLTTNAGGVLRIGRYGITIDANADNKTYLLYVDSSAHQVNVDNLYVRPMGQFSIKMDGANIVFLYGTSATASIEHYANHVFLTGTWVSDNDLSDARVKNTIEEIPDQYETLFDHLNPSRYKYNNGTSGRFHTGFVAQEVDAAIEAAGLTTQDFAGVMLMDKGTDEEHWYLRRDEFVALNTWQIQKLKARVAELEKKLEAIT